MKHLNIITKLCLTVGVILIASCSNDFLTLTPNDQLQTTSSYKTPKQVEQAIVGIYSNLRFLANDEYLYLSEVRSDNAWSNPKTDGLREYSEIGTFRAGSDITTFSLVWNEWYKIILDANTAISKIPDITFNTQSTKDQFLGEAYFLRGWAYFELARLFGNVPIIDKPLTIAEVKTIKQSPAADVYKTIIIPDMSKAEALLPVSSDMITSDGTFATDYGRADKIAAKAMLGRIYMTMAGFPVNDPVAQDSAEVKLKGVIDFSVANANKYWAPDSTEWKKQWISENNNKYSIFAIQYRSGGTGNTAIFNFSPGLPPTYTSVKIYGNQIYIDKTLMYKMSLLNSNGKPDSRVYNTTILTGYNAEKNWPAYSNLLQTVTLPDGTVINNVFSNSMFYKYTNTLRKRAALGYTANIETAMKDYNDWPVNYPVIRLEDVQLMYAEVLLNKYSNITGAIGIVNAIRTRAGDDNVAASLSITDALAAVKAERRIELCGEGVRWFDLVRWNDWKKAITDKFVSYNTSDVDVSNIKNGRYLYPIPQSQMLVQPGLYIQNPDYN